MPETLSSQDDQGSLESQQGALTSKELLESSRRSLNEGRSEMSTDMTELDNRRKQIEIELAAIEPTGDKVTASNLRFELQSIVAQMDELSRRQEQKAE